MTQEKEQVLDSKTSQEKATKPAEEKLKTSEKPSESVPNPEVKPSELETSGEELEAEIAKMKDQLLRALAEAENTRRRAAKDREDISKYAIANFARELLAVADNLKRAIDSVPAEARATDNNLSNLLVGVEATERQLHSVFEKMGIRKMSPVGQPFDPHAHRVMMEMEDKTKAPGTIITVLQDGYTIHDRLLREAMVSVTK